MAGERTLPGAGLYGYWTLGSNGYKPQMDENLLRISALLQAGINSVEDAEPGAPVNGTMFIAGLEWVGVAAANSLVLRENDLWYEMVPGEGWEVYNKDTDLRLRFDGTDWADPYTVTIPPVVFPDYSVIISEKTADYSITNGDLDGRHILVLNSLTDQTATIPAGLTGTEPVTLTQTGAGRTIIAGAVGVNITSEEGALTLRAAGSSATLIPLDTDVYLLVGGLEA